MENTAPQAPQNEMPEEFMNGGDKKRRTMLTLTVILLVCAIAACIWVFVHQNGTAKADEKIALADIEQNDSVATTLYAEAAKAGYKSGNRAKVEMGIRLFRQGKYEEAIKYLDDASIDDNIVAAGVEALKGDCYVNLQQLDKALGCYDDAISEADENPQIVPLMLIKKANIFREQKNYAAEAKAYKAILDDYPRYAQGSQTDIRKYYERAEAQAEK
jgi:tetratricopeptide (TPR) repeat protein